MTDPRMESLAELLIGHSVSLKKGEHVLIEAFDIPEAMVVAIGEFKTSRTAGGAES